MVNGRWARRNVAGACAAAAVAFLVQLASCGGGDATGNNPLTGMGGEGGPAAGQGGDSGSGGGGPGGGGWWSILPSWKEVAAPILDASGGPADVTGGQGQAGGVVHLVSAGPLAMASSWPLAAPPEVPAVPGDAQPVGSDALAADVAAAGAIHLDGDLTTGGGDAVRTITAQAGDIFVSGTLRAADLGAGRQGITLNAPQGTVYVTGTIDAAGTASSGQTGGAITITAQRIVVTGTLSSVGGDGITAGGAAGTITLRGLSDVIVAGTVRVRGGGALSNESAAQGAPGGLLQIDAPGTIQIAGAIDVRGGFATARIPGGAVAGGAGGAVKVGEAAAPANLVVSVPIVLNGGSGSAVAGAGGTLALEAKADFSLAANITAIGGSIVAGNTGEGGPGGTVTLEIASLTGNITVDAAAVVDLGGGRSGGAAKAGGGGKLRFQCWDGTFSMAGTMKALGGTAPDPGGEGGLGGQVYLFSDANYDGVGGNLNVEATGLIDVSGGAGTIGGSARNDGTWDVALFPEGLEMIAVLLNSDGLHGTPKDGVTQMMGRIVARGGATNGNGGDIEYHGKGLDGASDPEPGNVDTSGDGTGMPGQVLME